MRRAAAALALVAAVACSGGGGESAKKRAPPERAAPTTTRVAHGPEDLRAPATLRTAAGSLDRVERTLRAAAAPPGEIARLGWEQQNAYRALSAHPDWVPGVLARLSPDVREIVSANERARRELSALAEPQPSLPDWQILTPPPVDLLRAFYHEAETTSGIPWAYFAAIHLVETNMGRIRGASTAGALGPMQFIPSTWQEYGQGDINDNRDSILAAARLLRAGGGPADMSRALFRYNNSNRYVAGVESYARLMLANERAFLGYYHWQVYYSTTSGTFLLPEGYPTVQARRITAAR